MGVFIGADGGGSKLMLCLAAEGVRSFSKTERGVNPVVYGSERSAADITRAMLALCEREKISPSDVNGVFAGIAGATENDYRSLLKGKLEKAFPNAACGVSHDGENIVYAAFPDSDGAVVICGTGSSCFVRKGEQLFRIGGYGAFDLEGNGYELGRRAIAHTLKSYDGRAERSVLCEKVESLAGGNCLEKLSFLLALPVSDTARFAAAVFEAAEEGDAYAMQMLDSTARFLADYLKAASRFFDGRFDAVTAGGIGTNQHIIQAIRKLVPEVGISALGKDPAEGALVKAERLYYGRKHL